MVQDPEGTVAWKYRTGLSEAHMALKRKDVAVKESGL